MERQSNSGEGRHAIDRPDVPGVGFEPADGIIKLSDREKEIAARVIPRKVDGARERRARGDVPEWGE